MADTPSAIPRWQPLAERQWLQLEQQAATAPPPPPATAAAASPSQPAGPGPAASSSSPPPAAAQPTSVGSTRPTGGGVPPVSWAPDARSPDYSHLVEYSDLSGRPFELTAADLELLVNANRFRLIGDGERPVVFALRGALLAKEAENVDAVALTDARPDHRTFRCVIGYWWQRTRKLSAYRASTVPNLKFMTNYYLWNNGLGGSSSTAANLALTGSHVYRMGAHGGGRVYPALRQTDAERPDQDGRATVLRTRNDLTFDKTDMFDLSSPYNNVHCAYAYDSFSSAGSLTVQGPNGEGPWGQFQAFLKTVPVNTRFDLILLTGLEAAIAGRLRKATAAPNRASMCDRLIRLRLGSHGDAVSRLQEVLGMRASGYFGPVTTKTLADLQMAKLGAADGIYSPPMDKLLGLDILGPECRE